ncbi:hypothetical protein EDC04DRAFT_2732895 [Pisolithus marmoratus]|nr:hypothetical protein EDC04DRAFT_2732895 [Pisolithus marmoratus]
MHFSLSISMSFVAFFLTSVQWQFLLLISDLLQADCYPWLLHHSYLSDGCIRKLTLILTKCLCTPHNHMCIYSHKNTPRYCSSHKECLIKISTYI